MWVTCLNMSMCHLYAWCLQRNQEEAVIATKTGVSDVMWVWESDLVLLQETTVLLTMGPSFYSLFLAFLKVLLLKVFFRGDNDEWVRAFPSVLMTWVQPSGCPWCEKRTVSRSYTLPLKHTFSSYEHILTLSLNIKIYKCLNFNFYWEFGRFTSILKHCLNFLDNKHLSL